MVYLCVVEVAGSLSAVSMISEVRNGSGNYCSVLFVCESSELVVIPWGSTVHFRKRINSCIESFKGVCNHGRGKFLVI
jgi:hypothetical protein